MTDIRKVVIKWDGSTIGTFNDDELITLDGMTGIYASGHFYVPGNKAGNSAYGWCTDDSCGTCSSPNGDNCNSFDVTRYNVSCGTNKCGPGSGGSSNDVPGGNGTFWGDGSNLDNGGNAGGSGVNTGNRGGGGGAGLFGGGGGGGNSGTSCSGGGGGGGGSIWKHGTGTWSNVSGNTGADGQAGGVSARRNTDPDYVSGHGGSGQNGLVVIIFQ